jgi:peptidoglycan/LPS O-acetylase OafA/YrhL
VVSAAQTALTLGGWPSPIVQQFLAHAFFVHAFRGDWILSLNGALWSMAPEAQFYLLFPILIRLSKRMTMPIFVIGAVALTTAYRIWALSGPNSNLAVGQVEMHTVLAAQLPGHLSEFALGIALAHHHVERGRYNRRLVLCTLLGMTPLALFARVEWPSPVAELALATTYCLVLMIGVDRDNHRATKPSRATAWLAYFGRASYSFFLIHFAICSLIVWGFHIEPRTTVAQLILLLIAFTPACTVAALAMHRYIEEPLWKKFRNSPSERSKVAVHRDVGPVSMPPTPRT